MKEFKWEKLNGISTQEKQLDEAMPILMDIINMEIKQNGKVSDRTKEMAAPLMEVLVARRCIYDLNILMYKTMKKINDLKRCD